MPRKKCSLTVQKPFPILKLPPEIRNRIWRYSLVKDGDVIIRPHGRQEFIRKIVPSCLRSGKELQRHREDDERRINSKSLALALVCRQLYLEAALIYYGENTFCFVGSPGISMLEGFTAAIGPRNASIVTVARFYTMDSCFPCLPLLPGLKQLTVPPPIFEMWDSAEFFHQVWRPELLVYAQNNPSVIMKALIPEPPFELVMQRPIAGG